MASNFGIYSVLATAPLAAGRWLVTFLLLSAAAAWAAEPTFTNVTATVVPGLRDPHRPCVAWGDYDNDGRLDLLLTSFVGDAGTDWQPANQIWRNTGSGFTNVTAIVAPCLSAGWRSASRRGAWADFDNDGRLDFVVVGHANSQLWRNTGTGFTNVTTTVAPGLPKPIEGFVAWGDYDNDGRSDLVHLGNDQVPSGAEYGRRVHQRTRGADLTEHRVWVHKRHGECRARFDDERRGSASVG